MQACDTASAVPAIQVLHPGDVGCATRGDQLHTLLGSCVAIMLTDPRRTVGAMCHFVHPGDGPDARYAARAFAELRRLLLSRGIQPGLCEAHVAGGGNLFPDLVSGGDVGSANVRVALDWLDHLGVPVRTRSLGEACYRKVAWAIGEPAPRVECHAL